MQLVAWVPLGRWNFQPCCPTGWVALRSGSLTVTDGATLLSFTVPVLVFWYASRRGWRWVMWASLAGYGAWLGLQLASWWPPYILGASPGWARVYERAFAQSVNFLPRWGNHLPPDAMHTVLQILLVGALVTGYLSLRRRDANSGV